MASNQLLASLLQGYESSGDDAEPQNDLHNRIPLPPRLEEEVFDSPDTIIEFINNFAQNHGYAVSKRRSKRAKNGHIKTVFVKCSLGGEYHDRVVERTRQESTILTDYPFSIVLRLQQDDTWLVNIKEKHHNHDLSPISTHSVHCYRQILEHATQIEAQLENGIDTRHIIASLRKKRGDNVGFSFMKNEKEESYSFILKSLEQALMGAIEAIFLYTRNILCIWHIQKNLMVKCRPALRQEVIRIDYEGKGMKSTLVDEFKEKVEAHWVAFWAKYSHNVWDTVFEYIKKEWLQEDTAKHFLKYYTNEYLHLNKQASSQVEGAH
ncbi:hypothetical protein TSTA_000200 [Talaromyces stipitatus ATCC 10500]|uniref:FAR1 domain-containing protein n=1 Tax=Talaromyces stipitatus (strain ATCC 10500 / CBS 375.48 / QM 6759 / NRRL 1006) TaxID=441959 RepID=B8MSE7_TALSN|nr:uncharacterized protein TSTA_000200 [Talaromyces stipitatus ATCC 10500]EED11942.1 hypothetical protein TSTA_000200 [Talaromyces stipitatus ATCC 10500]